MYQELRKIRPDLANFTEQNITDRYRYITSKSIISALEQNIIKDEIYRSHIKDTQQNISINSNDNEPNNVDLIEPANDNTNTELGNVIANDRDLTLFNKLNHVLEGNLMKYTGTDSNARPPLPKIHPNKQVEAINQILQDKVIDTMENIQLHVYCAALTILSEMKITLPVRNDDSSRKTSEKIPAWKRRIESKINHLRSDLAKLLIWIDRRNDTKQKLRDRVYNIFKHNDIKVKSPNFEEHLALHIDTLKQKIAALGKRLRRYNISSKRKSDNKRFTLNQKQFYNNLAEDQITGKAPTLPEIDQFWRELWSNPVQYNSNADWIDEEANRYNIEMNEPIVTIEDLRHTVQKLHNWKAAGPDGVHNFWWKYITALHTSLIDIVNHIIDNPTMCPLFMTQAITYLKPKNENTQNPKNYRPITCLNTIYKIISSLIANKINNHAIEYNIIQEEQKGCRRNSRGCKEQLIIDAVITNQANKSHKNLSVAWIDYQKAYDSVPHQWLQKVLEIYKIHPKIISLLKTLMGTWRTQMILRMDNCTLKSEQIPIKRGIFQGDTFSPLWFCLALNPLSNMLNQSNTGFKLTTKRETLYTINHLLYMDDLKLYANNKNELTSLINITSQFSTDIRMDFGMDKCACLNIIRGKVQEPETISLILKNLNFPAIGPEDSYKYLGYSQCLTKSNKDLKQQVQNKFKSRLHKILRTELIAKNKIKAINTWSIPALTYSFGILNWSPTDLEALNRLIRTTLTKYRMHHPKAATERLYLPRKEGGRGLLDIKNLCNKQIVSLKKFFVTKAQSSLLHNAVVKSDLAYTPLNLSKVEAGPSVMSVKDRIAAWRSKALHGRFPHSLDNADKEASVRWLRDGSLFGETEGFIQAIQDQVIATNNYKKYIEKLNVEDRCRRCHRESETIDHIISSCDKLANTEYIHRHNLTANILHQALSLKYSLLPDNDIIPYYDYKARPVIENDTYKLYYDIPIHTDKTIPANKPDLVLHNIKDRTAFFLDVTHPNDHNINKAEEEKIKKYIPLSIEYKEIHKLKSVQIIPIVITATGLVNKNLSRSLEKLKLDPNTLIPKMQKNVILETCRIVRTVLNMPNENIE